MTLDKTAIEKILRLYGICDRNAGWAAKRFEKEVGYSISHVTIIKYWKNAEYETMNRGGDRSSKKVILRKKAVCLDDRL